MGFTEKTHAFIAASFYKYLLDELGERGKEAFIHATVYYGSQRGRRMAQRAIRDGRKLDFATYLEYGEWVSSEELAALGETNKTQITSFSPDYTMKIYICPWHQKFMEMELKCAGEIYCSYIDRSIAQGFDPNLDYQVPQTLYDHDCCVQTVKNAGIKKGEEHPKKLCYVKDFSYHTAHAFYAYKEVVSAIFGKIGDGIVEKVLEDFKNSYGQDMLDELLSFEGTNFNIC